MVGMNYSTRNGKRYYFFVSCGRKPKYIESIGLEENINWNRVNARRRELNWLEKRGMLNDKKRI
jgi:hypothetical protein